METKYFGDLYEIFSELSIGDEIVLLRDQGGSTMKNFGKVKSIQSDRIKLILRDGKPYGILDTSYDENTNVLKLYDYTDKKYIDFNNFVELYSILKIRDHNTAKITKVIGRFNPLKFKEAEQTRLKEEQKDREIYEEYLDIKDNDDIYTPTQIESLNDNIDEMIDVIDQINDGDKVYIYQSPMFDLPKALREFWEDWLDEHGTDNDSILAGCKESPNTNDMYDQDNVNRISFIAEVDDDGKIYVKKPIEQTNKLDGVDGYIKSGHFFNSSSLKLDDNDKDVNVHIHGLYSLEINSIYDIKVVPADQIDIDPDEDYDDPENEFNQELSDAEIMKMISNDKEMTDFLHRKPNFWDFIKTGGKLRKNKPFTKGHYDYFRNKIKGFETGKLQTFSSNDTNISNGQVKGIGKKINTKNGPIDTGTDITLKPVKSYGKVVIYVYNENKKLLGKIFTKDDVYDFKAEHFKTNQIKGEFKSNNEKSEIVININ